MLLLVTSHISVASEPDVKKILVLGDSLSAGYGLPLGTSWVDQLADRLRQQKIPYQVVNASVSGDTSSGALARLTTALNQHQPDTVIIEIGGNDGLRGLPLPALQQNLSDIVVKSKLANARVLLVAMQLPPNYGAVYTQGFADIYHAVATAEDVPLAPFPMLDVALDSELMLADGIHPNAQGQQAMLRNLWPDIEALLSEP